MTTQGFHNVRHVEFIQRHRFGRNGAKNGADTVQMPKYVDAETGHSFDLVGEVGSIIGVESLFCNAIHDFTHGFLDDFGRQPFFHDGLQTTVDAGTYRVPGDKMQV